VARHHPQGRPPAERDPGLTLVPERVERLLTQQPQDRDKLYALHAPEVECIGKGKARTRYEFGVKCSLAVTNARAAGGQFVLGARTVPGNPYDGHTLAHQIDQIEALTGQRVRRAYVDRGYRGHKLERQDLTVVISHTRGIVSPTIRREMRRRNAIEPVIGHLKSDGLMERNPLKGARGDAINVILTAAGHNLRLLLGWPRLYCAWILAAVTAALGGPHLSRKLANARF
jgi:IS5 family transposase